MDTKKLRNLINFALELKILVRDLGRSNVISKRELEELLVKYDINTQELKRLL